MCKAIKAIDNILDVCKDVNSYFKEKSNRLEELEKMQMDILHFIENEKFNAYKGYLYAKALQDIRKERRIIKNEVDIIKSFGANLGNIIKLAEQSRQKVASLDSRLNALLENKVYNPRIISQLEDIIPSKEIEG